MYFDNESCPNACYGQLLLFSACQNYKQIVSVKVKYWIVRDSKRIAAFKHVEHLKKSPILESEP